MERIGFSLALASAILWGLAYTIDQKILEKTSPIFLVFVNSIIALAITTPIVIASGKMKSGFSLDLTTQSLIILAQVLALIANLSILAGIKILGASYASIFEIMYPFFVVLFSCIAYGSELNIYFFIGSFFLFIGSFLIIKFA